MSLNPDAFRAVLGRFASGVTVITCTDANGIDHGMTVSAFCSVSLTPPLISICVDHSASMHDTLLAAPAYAINILSADQEQLARRFAETGAQKFTGVGFRYGLNGAPLLDDALATLECRPFAQHQAGDHTILIGEAQAAAIGDAKPLLYYRGGFATLER